MSSKNVSQRRPSRRNSPSAKSQIKLMQAAEALVGRYGLRGVSARAVAEAAKFKNNTSVQYHFGSLDNLFEHLLRYRMGEMEPYRQAMLDDLGYRPGDQIEPRMAIEVICIPHLKLRNRKGEFPYATFLCQYLPERFPGGFDWVMQPSSGSPSVISSLISEFRRSLSEMPETLFNRRLASATLLFLNNLRGIGKMPGITDDLSEEFLIQDSLRQAEAAMTAPVLGP
ncbi:MAG: hypothetical protein WCY92_04375 [Novosphingobium sp.]